MFSTKGLFKSVPCPNGPETCKLANCLFSHERTLDLDKLFDRLDQSVGTENGDRKRRKLEDGTKEVKSAQVTTNSTNNDDEKEKLVFKGLDHSAAKPESKGEKTNGIKLPASISRPISPPPPIRGDQADRRSSALTSALRSADKTQMKKVPEQQEALNPRIVPRNTTPHTTRYKLLKLLHDEFVRLNKEISKDVDDRCLKMSDNEIVRFAVEQEADVAIHQPSIYQNVMKSKYALYKKMKLGEWVEIRRNAVEQRTQSILKGGNGQKSDGPINVETNLTSSEEMEMLKRFVLKPEQMKQANFILVRPDEASIAEAKRTIASSGGYEVCERCGTRFQVFPNRREDGALSSGGKCVYHFGKPVYQKRDKTDSITGPKESLYYCCNQPKGSTGCTTGDSHVFKISSSNPARLASVLQFEHTPSNDTARKDLAVAFDCEMGYTCYGLEIIRLSAVVWPTNKPLIDILVRPVGEVLDLNSKFSGVLPRQFFAAAELDPMRDPHFPDSSDKLKIVPSPAAARSLLYSYISPATVLIGHAIDNDLNVLRMIHPSIVDTSLLYPHQSGLPFRYPLRKLAKDFLNLDIQTAGAAGHDSIEDSRATGDLVRYKIAKEWAKYMNKGWTVKDRVWFENIRGENKEGHLPPYMESQGWTKKRKAENDAVGGTLGWQELSTKPEASNSFEKEIL